MNTVVMKRANIEKDVETSKVEAMKREGYSIVGEQSKEDKGVKAFEITSKTTMEELKAYAKRHKINIEGFNKAEAMQVLKDVGK